MKVSRKRLRAELQHPDHSDLFFTLQRPDQFDIEELSSLFTKARESENGSMPEAVLKAGARYIVDIRGLEDEDTNQAIPYAGTPLAEKMDVLRVFADEKFFATLPEPRKVKVKLPDGSEKEVEQTKENFYSWILRKGNDPETFGISSGKG